MTPKLSKWSIKNIKVANKKDGKSRGENKMAKLKTEKEYAEINAANSNMIFDLAKKNYEKHPCKSNLELFGIVKKSIADNHSTYAYNVACEIK